MSRIFLYAHGGSGNHGCEAIVRATAGMLAGRELFLISASPEEDRQYGLSGLAALIPDAVDPIRRRSLDFLRAYAALKLRRDFRPMEQLRHQAAFDQLRPGDLALSIGGDNYCYADAWRYTMFHEMAKARGARTVLWGCSVEPELLKDPRLVRDLAAYDWIFPRESISYEALRSVNLNTVLAADPAFCLPMARTQLPAGFVPGNTVGINLSPLVLAREPVPGMVLDQYARLIGHILATTDLHIALIPHVVWEGNDDRVPLQQLYQRFSHTGRLSLVTDRSCMELKTVISQCRFFVAARTHAAIAAYSTGVPTLVLGYSVKARGIARDLFGCEAGFVLPVQTRSGENALAEAFQSLMDRETHLRAHLAQVLPGYVQRAKAPAEMLGLEG